MVGWSFEQRKTVLQDGAIDMGIEGQFAGLTARVRYEPVLVKDRRGNNYLDDVRSFAMLERDQEYELATRWREQRH